MKPTITGERTKGGSIMALTKRLPQKSCRTITRAAITPMIELTITAPTARSRLNRKAKSASP